MMEHGEVHPLAGTVTWLEDEQRQSKELLFRLQQQVEQLHALFTSQVERVGLLEEALAFLRHQLSSAVALEENVKQARQQLSQLEGSMISRLEGAERFQRRSEAFGAQLQEELVRLQQAVVATSAAQEALAARFQGAEEAGKRRQEEMAPLRQRVTELENSGLGEQLGLLAERGKRGEEEAQRLGQEVEALHQQDEAVLARLQILGEQVRQVGERASALESAEELRRNQAEQVELLRKETQRLAGQWGELQGTVAHLGERLEEQGRLLLQGQGRTRDYGERLAELREALGEHRRETVERLGQWAKLQEEQRRRLVTELEQQLRELRRFTVKAEET